MPSSQDEFDEMNEVTLPNTIETYSANDHQNMVVFLINLYFLLISYHKNNQRKLSIVTNEYFDSFQR